MATTGRYGVRIARCRVDGSADDGISACRPRRHAHWCRAIIPRRPHRRHVTGRGAVACPGDWSTVTDRGPFEPGRVSTLNSADRWPGRDDPWVCGQRLDRSPQVPDPWAAALFSSRRDHRDRVLLTIQTTASDLALT